MKKNLKDVHPKNESENYDLSNFGDKWKLLEDIEDFGKFLPPIREHLTKIIAESNLQDKYKILFIYEPYRDITNMTADQMYKALQRGEQNKDLLLILHSNGGSIEAAYLISKCCKVFSGKFVIAVPRRAKSAATLLSLGAKEIHMGNMSQLGPIDPQIGNLPALGLSDAIEYLAQLCVYFPGASDMFAKYLSFQLNLQHLGYFQRITQSAMQYAERLLEDKDFAGNKTIKEVAYNFVYSYKDHSFVIDKNEAKMQLNDMIKDETEEYKLADKIHSFLEEISMLASVLKKHKLSLVGDIDNGLFVYKEE